MLIRLLCCYGCYRLAKRKNHDEILALILGFCFPILSLIIYGCVK